MSTHKNIDRICAAAIILALILTVLVMNGSALGIQAAERSIGYEEKLFDTSRVHTIEIVMDDWEGFIDTCESETYSACSVVIDNEAYKNVAIRGKGNTSLSTVSSMGSQRYSFKLEFDHYEEGKSYHGLDKLSLNNIIQDNTYMKDYLAYRLMAEFGVDTPLCSFVWITVNGEDWGLYLAVEGVEDSFLQRNYGRDTGELYKPDSMSFGGGGPGNGKDFSMSDFMNRDGEESEDTGSAEAPQNSGGMDFGNMPDFGDFDFSQMPDFGDFDFSQMPDFGDFDSGQMPDFGDMPSDFDPSEMFGGGDGKKGGFGGFGMGSSDVKLQYIDDEPSSYSNIFNNAKTTVNEADQKRLIASLKALSEQTDLENTLDTDEVLRYFVVHNFVCNGDSYTGQMIHNYYLYEKNGQLSMIPWDYNLAYGSFMGTNASSSVNSPIDTPVSGGMSDRPMVSWIFDDAAYTEQYHQLFAEFLDSTDFSAVITETAELIDKYVEKDPTKFCTYEDFQKGVEALRTFCELREESVRGQLNGTIPATSDGQKADSSALIDTGDLTISDMGTMNMGGGGGFGGFGGRSGKQDGEKQSGGSEQSGRPEHSGRRGKSEKTEDTEQTEQPQAVILSFGSGARASVQTLAARPGFGGGNPPEGFDPDNMPEGFDPGNMPGGFGGGNAPEDFDSGNMPGGWQDVDSSADDAPVDQASDGQAEKPAGKADSANSGRPQPGGGFPGMTGSTPQDNTTAYILLGVSALVLLIGLGFAIRFKR